MFLGCLLLAMNVDIVCSVLAGEPKSPTVLLNMTTGTSQDRSIAVPIFPPEGLDDAPTEGTKAEITWKIYIATAKTVRKISFFLCLKRSLAVVLTEVILI